MKPMRLYLAVPLSRHAVSVYRPTMDRKRIVLRMTGMPKHFPVIERVESELDLLEIKTALFLEKKRVLGNSTLYFECRTQNFLVLVSKPLKECVEIPLLMFVRNLPDRNPFGTPRVPKGPI